MSNQKEMQQLLANVDSLTKRIEMLREYAMNRVQNGSPPMLTPEAAAPPRMTTFRDAVEDGLLFDEAADALGRTLGLTEVSQIDAAYSSLFALESVNVVTFYEDPEGRQRVRWNKSMR